MKQYISITGKEAIEKVMSTEQFVSIAEKMKELDPNFPPIYSHLHSLRGLRFLKL